MAYPGSMKKDNFQHCPKKLRMHLYVFKGYYFKISLLSSGR